MNPSQTSATAILFAAQQAQANQNNANNANSFGTMNTQASPLNAGGVFQSQQQLQFQLQQQFQPLADNLQVPQQNNNNLSNELKLLQQLQREIESQNSNALLLPSNRMNESAHHQAAALLQSVLDHRVRNQRLETPLSQNFIGMGGINSPLLQGHYLNDARLLMTQPNQFGQQSILGGQLPIQSSNLFPRQVLQRAELPLPSPHSLFHRDGTKRMRGGVIEPFPEKLHRLLTEVEAAGRSDVISFVASGRAFAIHKPDKFFKEIVPLYFRQSRLSSFKRQLNLYGFELINTGPARGGYYHELFIKDQPEACRRMRRVAVKVGSSGKRDEGGDLEKGTGKGEKRSVKAEADDEEEEEDGDEDV
jgi:HSF-type DNA-binding